MAYVTVPLANFAFQMYELAMRAAFTTLWASLLFRISFSAYAKRSSSPLQMLKTAAWRIRHGAWKEATMLLLIVLIYILTGFYTTLITANLDTQIVYGSTLHTPLARSLSSNTYGQLDVNGSIWDAVDVSVPRPSFKVVEMGETDAERMHMDRFGPSMDRWRSKDSTGGNWTLWLFYVGDNPLNGDSVHTPMGDWVEIANYDRNSSWPFQYEEGINVRFASYDRLTRKGEYAISTPNIQSRGTWVSSSVNVTYQGLLLRGEKRETVMLQTVKATSYQRSLNANESAELQDEHGSGQGITMKKDSLYHKHILHMDGGVATESWAEERLEEVLYTTGPEQRVAGCTVVSTMRFVGRVPEGEDDKTEELGWTVKWDDKLTRIGGSHDAVDPADERQLAALRVLQNVLSRDQVAYKSAEPAYELKWVLIWGVLPVALVVLALVCQFAEYPFVTNSITENLYVSNNAVLDDCASNGRKGMSEAMKPEMWMRERIDFLTTGQHFTVSIGESVVRADRKLKELEVVSPDRALLDRSS